MLAMPLSNKEKQDAYRARKAELGLAEVRGIFLPPELHEKLKEAAKKLLRKVPPSRKPTAK
jgi:galactose-1-phosphate uridylyltransferase